MKTRSFLLRCAAFFLMLIFFQKAGAGLFYHNLFHSNSANESRSDADKSIGFSCTCIDDFLVPFERAEQTQLSVPPVKFILITENIEDRLPVHELAFAPLRGPPSAINA